MNVLICCEFSGTVRDEFAAKGHNAVSCDLLPGDMQLFKNHGGRHVVADAIDMAYGARWDLIIGHPPCTYLSYAGMAHWEVPGREQLRKDALGFFLRLWEAPCEKICLENPLGYVSRFVPYSQIIHPYQFGEPYKKRTCLWLKNLPALRHTEVVDVPVRKFASGKIKSGIDVISYNGSGNRNLSRSVFWPGIAKAMADQWG